MMKTARDCQVVRFSASLLFVLLWSTSTSAHTAIAVNGSMQMTIKGSGLVVEYQIECGAHAPVDVRSRIDTNGDGSISQKELQAFNETARRKVQETESLCYLLMDARPVKLLPQKVEFTVDDTKRPRMVLMKFSFASDTRLSPGSHRLVLESNFCPFDGELLSLPDDVAPLAYHRHGMLVRIIKVVAVGEPSVKFSHVSAGHISERGGERTVQCLLNNITKRVQINFTLADAQPNERSPTDSEQGTMNGLAIDALTGATLIASRSPVRVTEISTIDALSFDPQEKDFGTISYKLSRRAWVRIRVVLRTDEQLVLRTLVDWSKREAGKNVETWDGRDAAGHLIDKARFPCFIVIEADSERHQKHLRTLCKDPRLTLKLKDSPTETASGKVNIDIALDESARGYGEQFGYMVRAYVDFKVVHSFTHRGRAWQGLEFPLDTSHLSPGEHLLTVVVDDGADHVGSTSLKFNVAN